MSDELLDLLQKLDEKQRSDIKRCLSLDVSQAIRVLSTGGKLTTLTRAKYGYYFNKFRIKITDKQEKIAKNLESYQDKDFMKDFMINNKLEQF
tara:strand:+ start:172 stop:450 length:279 start_codon:yes stop_codon:yes gene_type:complete